MKVVLCALLAAAAVAVLFTVVFPWAEPRLPFTDVTVEDSTSTPAPSSSG